jgi:penicillin-binding protein 2
VSRHEPLFGPAGEVTPQKGRANIKRDQGGHERWADAILPADAEAGIIETPTNRRPLLVVAGIIVLAAAILAVQMFNLEILNGARNLGLADGNRLRQKITRAPRGVIYDRHKNVLAQNLASFDVTVIPSLLPRDKAKRQSLYVQVASLISKTPAEVETKAETDCINGEVTKKTPRSRAEYDCLSATQPVLIVNNLDRDTALNFDQSSSQVPGFSLDTNPIREYEDSGTLAAILGYTGRVDEDDLKNDRSYATTDFIGKLGLEKQYEPLLRGQNGSEQTEVDASGRPIKLLSAKPSVPGKNLVLSVDMDLQRKLSESIQTQMQASGSTQAAGIAISPKTGEVLAAVNLPTYDNNLFAKGISQTDYSKLLKDPAQPLFNKVIGGAYPTGSIIKPLIGSAALQEHVVDTNTSVDDKGQLEIPNKYDPNIKYTFRSYEPGGLGIVNITRAIAVSSNVFFYTLGGGFGNIGGLGVDRLTSYYHRFGLGHKTGIDIPEETSGTVPTPASKKKATGEDWYLGDTYNISVGQGDLRASPLQMAVAIAAIANGGNVLQPHFLKEVMDAGGRITQTTPTRVVDKGFIDPANLAVIQAAMKQVVSAPYGTACCKIAQEVPVAVAAKTGTAETVVTANGDVNQSKPNAWFTAYAPADDPQIAIVVLLTHAGEGAQFAAPAVRETLTWCFARAGGCVQ